MSETKKPRKRAVPDFSGPARETKPNRDYEQKGVEVQLDPLVKRGLDRTAQRLDDDDALNEPS